MPVPKAGWGLPQCLGRRMQEQMEGLLWLMGRPRRQKAEHRRRYVDSNTMEVKAQAAAQAGSHENQSQEQLVVAVSGDGEILVAVAKGMA